MRTATIVSRVLSDCKDYMHVTRWQRLVDLSNAALNGRALVLTQLALGGASNATVRHRVKAVDRFLGNPAFATEHLDIYRTLPPRARQALTQGQEAALPQWQGALQQPIEKACGGSARAVAAIVFTGIGALLRRDDCASVRAADED